LAGILNPGGAAEAFESVEEVPHLSLPCTPIADLIAANRASLLDVDGSAVAGAAGIAVDPGAVGVGEVDAGF